MLRRTSAWVVHSRPLSYAQSSTVDASEVDKFQSFTSEWWDEFGPMKALHSMNQLRVPMVRDGLINTIKTNQVSHTKPLKGLTILDVGCGGGILAEPLARLGAKVTGIDANGSLVHLAAAHAKTQRLSVDYQACSVEEHALHHPDQYHAVIASEIVEHVTNKERFVNACVQCLKPRGSIFFTTISKSFNAKFFGIFVAENVLDLVPKGTHDYEKFIEPHRLQKMLEDCSCRTQMIHGLEYNPLKNKWCWSGDTSIIYGLQAVKVPEEKE